MLSNLPKIRINKYINIYILLLVLATCIMGIGYASVNSVTLDINGNIAATIQNGIYIESANYHSNNDAILENSDIIAVQQTMLATHIELSKTNPSTSITYSLKIYNSTNETYYFQKVDYLENEATYSNENILVSLSGLVEGTALESKDSIEFQVTFFYKDGIIPQDNTLTSYLTFVFKRKFQITYENLDDQYQNEIFEGENLLLDLANEVIYGVNIYLDNVVFQDYIYNYKQLSIENVTGNLRIVGMKDLGYDIIVTNNKNEFITIDQNTTGDILVSEYKTRSLSGTNLSTSSITKIEITLTFTSTTGSKQSVDTNLSIDNQTPITKNISFGGKVTSETVTLTFDNISIGYNQTFTITNTISKITNEQINLHTENIKFYFE